MKGVAFTVDLNDTGDMSEVQIQDEKEAELEYQDYRKMISRVLGPISNPKSEEAKDD